MLGGTDIYRADPNPGESIKMRVMRTESRKQQDRGMYYEAAKRVLFHKCLVHCGYELGEVKLFNKEFYDDDRSK